MIIGLVGLIGSGKDTVADYLIQNHGYRKDSFAAPLKDAVASVFGWDRSLVEGSTAQSRDWREQKDAWWSERLGLDISPRWALQYWGTEVCRNNFHADIWVASMEDRLRRTTDEVVIADCRFPNEIAAIKRAGGFIIEIQRGELPAWYHKLKDWLQTDRAPDAEPHFELPHASEWSWVGNHFIDGVVVNDGTLEDLYVNIELTIDSLIQSHYTDVLPEELSNEN
jgi:hypothetical protein